MEFSIDVVRVFVRGDRGGNHLGLHALTADLAPDTMQAIARSLGYSETIFVDLDAPADGPVDVRIFTPGREIPFAGHPLVGAAWWLHRHHSGPGRRDLRTPTATVTSAATDTAASITVPAGHPVTPMDSDDLVWLGASRGWVVAMPWPYHVYELRSPEAVSSLERPADDHPDEVLAFARLGATRAKNRFFAPGAGVPEDPATGSAAVALAAALRHEGQSRGELTISQGDEIGHPSQIDLTWGPDQTTVGGEVVAEPSQTVSL